ncbi:MAG: hypothetical protein A2233_00310 [Candidatus Kerfeldbacteria bacterium RIFOXYA2_FULL_38_24]|uniref:Sortilin N-terminal domain-containing protein n=1 Tax=Candidatus Kerfeldbacteria bacterium RIFOXYB2_FULL_38_14 TaxID=1798547 RepID=A0A1G2BA03_9BACT|nr:MAG: hypothetical protein A2233_00310 [Candidatus Kerfeldbacteria bacterium RIFOXYA2_FULL_38_24]OGY86038.1 MAG: hypothetical protein A2319_00515 [Candidatus Kerfeldbacteria bacterium RIFOXYB2_FULL_38_14]OGY90154.1 MAG: hypothetical protein A2458_04765 [Candidatus Kerfeldbacteria bacterium RIFOXYC2_FULL_38_9]
MKLKLNLPKIIFLLTTLVFFGASCSQKSDGGIFRTTDGGSTWEQRVFIGQEKKKVLSIANIDIQVIKVDPSNHNVIYLGTKANGIYKTDNGGQVWWKLPISSDNIRDIAIDQQYPNNIYALLGSNIIKSTDSGQNWEAVYTDTQNAVITKIMVDWFNQQKIIATTSIGTVLISENEGADWQVVYQVTEPLNGIEMSQTDSRIIYVLELDESLHKTTDGGLTWTDLFTENPQFEAFKKENKTSNVNEVKNMAMDPNNSNVLYVVTSEGIIKTLDGGRTWNLLDTLIAQGAEENSNIRRLVVLPGDSNTIFFTINNLIHKTTDGGLTWKTIEDFPSQRIINNLYIDSNDTNIMYAGMQSIPKKGWGFFGAPATK